MSKPNLKQVLLDLSTELSGQLLEQDFPVRGRVFTLRLLNAEETMWRNARIDVSSQFSALSSWKLPTLAIAIRKIDGLPIEEAFAEEWEKLDDNTRETLESANKYSKKYFTADYMMEYLSQLPDDFITDLILSWDDLSTRSNEAQSSLKKSYGESSEKEEKKS